MSRWSSMALRASPATSSISTWSPTLAPASGFLTRARPGWQAEHEATYPALRPGLQDDCTYDYDNTPAYSGASHSGACSLVEFAKRRPGLRAPVLRRLVLRRGGPHPGAGNDRLLHCSVCHRLGRTLRRTGTAWRHQTTVSYSRVLAMSANSAKAQAPSSWPTTDNALAAYAKLGNGCLYQGPTTITFDAAGRMSVWSPNTTTEAKPSNTCPGSRRARYRTEQTGTGSSTCKPPRPSLRRRSVGRNASVRRLDRHRQRGPGAGGPRRGPGELLRGPGEQ